MIRKELTFSLTLVFSFLLFSVAEVLPFRVLMEFGSRLKAGKKVQLDPYSFDHYQEEEDNSSGIPLMIQLMAGAHFWHPQFVIWAETEKGEFIKTIFITNSSANGRFYSGRTAENFLDFDSDKSQEDPEEETRLVDALPYWSHRRNIQTKDGFFAPTPDQPELDGISGATPKGHFLIHSVIPDSLKEFRILIETNVAFDENEFYSQYDFPHDTAYHSGTGLLGQPSLIYEAKFRSDSLYQVKFLGLKGHSHHSGQNGNLYTSLDRITTARHIIKWAIVEVGKK